MDAADRQAPAVAALKKERLQEKIATLRARVKALETIGVELAQAPDQQFSLTDPDSRAMKTRGTGVVGYNVQTAVETQHHLIVTHEVTNVGTDRGQLSRMAKQARRVLRVEYLTAIADRGYYSGEQILACHQAGIVPLVPKTQTSNAKADGRFDKAAFVYDPHADEYVCPAGERLIYRFSREEAGMLMHRYWSSACPRCKLNISARPATIDASAAGSTKRSLKRCRHGSMKHPTACASGDEPWSTPSERSRHGWGRRTFSPRVWSESARR